MTTTTQGRPATTGGAAHAAAVNPDALADLIARSDVIEAVAHAEYAAWEPTDNWGRAGETYKQDYRDSARAALAALLDLARELAKPDPADPKQCPTCKGKPVHTTACITTAFIDGQPCFCGGDERLAEAHRRHTQPTA